MATSLSSQLLQLAAPQTSIFDHKRDRRSILFDPSEAAKFGRDVYYDIGLSGYEVLAATDPVFRPFASSLFGRSSHDLQRAVETREVNAKLDLEIEKFLLLLCPYLEKEASLRALEWLVYRFQINEMNQQALLKCIFPYYESPLFTRILQVIALGGEGAEWHWLSGCQKGVKPLPKRTVFVRWAGSQAFRNFVADFLRSMIKVHAGHCTPAIVASFFITTVLGGLGATEVREEHLSSMAKSLPHCLASSQEQLVSGCYLLLSTLASKTRLAPTLTFSLMEALIKNHPPPPALVEQCLLCLLVLAHHQPLKELAPETAVALCGTALLEGLAQVAKERSVAALLSPYVAGYVRYLTGGEEETLRKEKTIVEFDKFMDELFSLPLSDSDAAKVMWSLYEAVRTHLSALQSAPSLLAAVGRAVRAVETVHPQAYTEATTRLAQRQDDPELGGEYRKVLRSLVLPASGSSGSFTQLLHPQETLREEASRAYLKKLDREEQSGGATVLHVRSMLSDDHPPIPLMALSTPVALAALPPPVLAEQCCRLLSKSGKGWQAVREASLAALSGSAAAHYDSSTSHLVLSTCLPYVLLPRTFSDLVLAKILLKSQLAKKTAFLSALKREAAPCLHSGGEARDYAEKIWSGMPRVVSGFGASELLSLCGVSESSREGAAEAKVMALALLHASLGMQGAKEHLGLKLAHKLIDLCLVLLETGKAATGPAAPPKNNDCGGDAQGLSLDQLRVALAQVGQGHPPLHLLTACVLRVCAAFTLPRACAHTPYWTPMMESEPGEGHLLLLIKVLKAALRLEAACNTAGCNAVLVKVFKECLPDPKFRFYFLAVVWGWQSSLPFTDIIDEALQAWTLVLGKALLSPSGTQSSSLAWTLGTHQPLVPSLLSALTSGEKGVRKGAIECLRALAGVRGGALAADSYVEVIRIILNQAEELLDDASQLAELFGGGGSSVGRKQATQSVLGVVVGGEGLLPPHVCAALLYSLSAANDTAILLQLLPLAESLLEKAEKTVQGREEQRNEEEGKLDVPSSLCLLYILQRYTPEAAEVLETKAGLRVFERAMESARPCLLLHDGVMAPQSVLLQEVLSSRFMASLKSEATASRLWTLLVSRVTSSRDPQEAGRLRHALRHVTLDAEVIMRQIDDLELTPKVTSLQAAKFKRMKMREPSVAHQQSWEKLQLMLETLTIMKDLQRPWLLVAPLTHWLNMTLTLDLTSTTLLQQQILSTLLHLLEKCVEELSEEEVSQRVQVNVEVIVACVRASLSHDTHRRALLILALCARIVPDAVLHNMMAIFTFMGTSLLRRDDAYSFEVIHHTIQSIVPTLIQHQGENKTLAKGAAVDDRLAQVCQVFVDALPDLPHHRRLPLLTQLATTLQPNPNLWLLLALLANSHVMKGGTRGYKGVGQEGKGDERVRVEEEEEEEERGTLPQVIQFSLTLASQFPATTQVLACVRLMQLVSTLPDDKETSKALQQHQQQRQQDSLLQLREQKSQGKKKGSNEMQKKSQEHHQENKDGNEEENLDFKKVNEAQLISRTISHSPRHTFHLKYTVTGLVAHLLASDKFIGKVYDAEEEDLEVKELQSLSHQLLEVTLCLLHNVNFACDLHKDKSAGRFFTSLQRKVVEVVERLVALLPPSSLLQVCQGLLSSPVALVRCRAAELISAKLQPHLNYFRSEDTRELQNTLQTLCRGVANKQEPVDNRQTFLYCLLMLTRLLSNRTASLPSLPPLPTPSLQLVLDTAVSVLCDESEEPWVVTQGLLVAAEAVAALQAAAVGCLGRLMPTLIKTLAASATTADAASTANTASDMAAATPAPAATTQLLATLTALHKVIDSLPQFLSPYIEEVTKQVCCIRPLEGATKTAAVGKESKVMAKLLAIRESLIKKVEPRILVPRLVKAFHSLLGAGALADLHNLVAMVGCLVGELGPKKLPQHIPALLGLLTNALDLRSLKGDGQEVEPVEEAIFSAISRLLLHLPEQDNISIFTSIITWATPPPATPAETPTAPARLISLYRFAEHLVSTYQVLFVAAHLAEALLPPTVTLLAHLGNGEAPPVFGEGKEAAERTCKLLEALLNTLTKVFKHDSVGFVTPERFELLSAPLTDLLDNEVGGVILYKRRVRAHLTPCLTQLAVAGGDDSLWRGLACQVLQRLKAEDRPQVVLGALEVFQSLVETLGEDFLRPLLADAIPPISEVLESTNQEVESATRTLFGKMEDILGDQLRAYLNY